MSRSFRRGRRLLLLTLLVATGTTGFRYGREWVEQIPYFHVTEVTLEGLVRMPEATLFALLDLELNRSVFSDLSPLEDRLLQSPLLASVQVTRRPPRRIDIRVEERTPVAFVPLPHLVAVDVEGVLLPSLDPRRHQLDLPVILSQIPGRGDGALSAMERRTLASELVRLQRLEPRLAHAISEVGMDARGDLWVSLSLPDTRLVFRPPLTAARLREAVLVLADVLERQAGVPPAELDLRFADQIVVRNAPGLRASPSVSSSTRGRS